MPRISAKLIQERETFTNANFAAGMNLEQANNALVEKYKMKMAPKRLKGLFDAHNKCETILSQDPIAQAIVGVKVKEAVASLDKPVVPVVPVVPVTPTTVNPMSFIRVYEAPSISKGGGQLLKVGELAKAIEEDKYEME